MRFVDQTAPLLNGAASSISPQVLAVGLPRCATSSMQMALERLGYGPCMHMAHVLPYPEREKMVIKALYETNKEARHKILRNLFGGFGATADYPGMIFADDLMDMYPDAPVVLNQRRNAAAWHKSVIDGLGFFFSWVYAIIGFPVATDRLQCGMLRGTEKLVHQRYGVGMMDIEVYELHNQWVRDEAARRGRKVLEFQAPDGWESLCNFLGKDVPNEPFPHLNDQKTMMELKRFIVVRGIGYWIAILGSGYACWRYWPQVARLAIDSLKQGHFSW